MIEELARHGYKVSAGTLYPILHGLEERGYLTWIGSVHDRTEREFGLPRHPDLADQHDVERGVESLGDLKTDRHAAARQGEYNWFLLPQLLQPRGKLAACRSPIGKHGRWV